MSESILTIYTNERQKDKPHEWTRGLNFFALTEDKNAIVDDLEEYLSYWKSYEWRHFQYLKLKLDMEVKVDLSQVYSHAKHETPLVYVKVEEDDETYYFFIRDYEWTSENSVRLVLHMDILNTFQMGTDYKFGGENIIQRQHEDRFKYHYEDGVWTGQLWKLVNWYPENIQAPLYKRYGARKDVSEDTANATLLDNRIWSSDQSTGRSYAKNIIWYLVWIASTDSSTTNKRPCELLLVPSQSVTFQSGTTTTKVASIYEFDRTNPSLIKIVALPYCPLNSLVVEGSTPNFSIVEGAWNFGTYTYNKNELNVVMVSDFSLLSLSATIPFDLRFSGMNIDTSPIYDRCDQNALTVSARLIPGLADLGEDPDFDEEMETKLLSSEFTYKKIFYDSFSIILKYEDYDEEPEYYKNIEENISVKITATQTPNFRLLVQLVDPLRPKYVTDDYGGQMVISRNNELAIFSDDYIDYIRGGYNYDVKAKNLSNLSNATSIFTNIFDPGKLMTTGSMVSGATKGIVNTLMGELQSENSIAKTLTEKTQAGETVAGSDDLDLLNTYTANNKFEIAVFEPHSRLKTLLIKYFQLMGYACNKYGEPDMDSRTCFNFAQCDPDFEYYRYMNKDMRDELEAKWSGGVFKVHHCNGQLIPEALGINEYGWDLCFDSANIETEILKATDIDI